jgi:hypothetical protein
MTTDPNELAQTPGTPTAQELAAVAATPTPTIPTPGTPSAEQQQPPGDSSVAHPLSPAAEQPTTPSPGTVPAQQPVEGLNPEQKLEMLWQDFLKRLGVVQSG